MKALVQTRCGPPEEVLEVQEVAAPAVGEGEVLVRVRAAGTGSPQLKGEPARSTVP